MRAPRVPVEEQYRLIMECRKSGLSDYQWCLKNDINPGTFYNWVKRLRKNGCGDIPEKNQLSTYEHSHQEVVKIEMNSISVPTDMNKNTDTAAMELMIGNMNLRISNETDPLLLAKTIQILAELSCWAHTRRYFIDAVPKGKQYDYSNPAVQGVQFCSKLFEYERRSQNKKQTFEQRKR